MEGKAGTMDSDLLKRRVICWIVPGNACRSLNSDDLCYLDQFWKIQVISMTDVSSKPLMRPLPCNEQTSTISDLLRQDKETKCYRKVK